MAGAHAGLGERLREARKPEPVTGAVSVTEPKNQLNLIPGKKPQNPVVGGGKVEIQTQDSHFSTTPSACGSKERSM
jgi:hypothetical protein